jgi:hypothetical protein
LLVLDDQPPDLPVSLHHRRIDGAVGAGASRFENGTDLHQPLSNFPAGSR